MHQQVVAALENSINHYRNPFLRNKGKQTKLNDSTINFNFALKKLPKC